MKMREAQRVEEKVQSNKNKKKKQIRILHFEFTNMGKNVSIEFFFCSHYDTKCVVKKNNNI